MHFGFFINWWDGPIEDLYATLISEKLGRLYSQILFWIRCKLFYILLRSAVMFNALQLQHTITRFSYDLVCSNNLELFVYVFFVVYHIIERYS